MPKLCDVFQYIKKLYTKKCTAFILDLRQCSFVVGGMQIGKAMGRAWQCQFQTHYTAGFRPKYFSATQSCRRLAKIKDGGARERVSRGRR